MRRSLARRSPDCSACCCACFFCSPFFFVWSPTHPIQLFSESKIVSNESDVKVFQDLIENFLSPNKFLHLNHLTWRHSQTASLSQIAIIIQMQILFAILDTLRAACWAKKFTTRSSHQQTLLRAGQAANGTRWSLLRPSAQIVFRDVKSCRLSVESKYGTPVFVWSPSSRDYF